MINEKFRIVIVGDLDYEDLIADIYFEDQILVMLTQETGFQNLRINIYPPPENKELWDFSFDEFEAAIQHAKKRLWELRRIPDENSENENEDISDHDQTKKDK